MAGVGDKWSTEAYTAAASFVPKLTATVVSYLDVHPNERILDIGCGDGPLTSQIASSAPDVKVLGLDASANFVSTAKAQYEAPNCTFKLQDCRKISQCAGAVDGSWDKVFSNAALHWILRDPSTRKDVFRDVFSALKPGGRFVFEFGGKGNVGEVHAAIVSVLTHHGIPLQKANDANPWFFPSDAWLRDMLTDVGFEVEKAEMEYRPTKLTARSEDGSGGLEGWVRLMGAEFLAVIGDQSEREQAVREICDVLEPIVTREEDGSQWIGYVRLRGIARKP